MLESLIKKISSKELSAVELATDYLAKIKKDNEKVGAFIEVDEERYLKDAEDSQKRIDAGKQRSELEGIPIGIKDNIVRKGCKTSCASKILESFISPYSATVINRLESAGMIPVGRLNMDEFAMGSSTENSAMQLTRNPHDLERSPGGSSGGSAAAVSAAMVPVSLGSDTGGSIRQPAAFCGVVGLKPTYGSISRYGLVAFASSLDQIGPLATSVSDVEKIFEIIKGADKQDSTSVQYKPLNVPALDEMTLGIPVDLIEQCSDEVKSSFDQVKEALGGRVKAVKEISLSNQKLATPVYYLIANSEASANLARFDGVRYGQRIEGENLQDLYEKSRTAGFGTEVKRRILLGTFALSSGYYDAYYGKAQKVRSLICHDYVQAFKDVDVIIMPTTPSPAFKIGEKIEDPIAMYLNDLLTVGASLAGVAAISVPGPTQGLPVGIQLQANYFGENLLFEVGKEIENTFKATPAKL